MIQDQLIFLAPELTLLVFALAVILFDLFVKNKGVLAVLSIAGVIVSGIFAALLWGRTPDQYFFYMLASDNFAILFKFLLLISVGLVLALLLGGGAAWSRVIASRSGYFTRSSPRL